MDEIFTKRRIIGVVLTIIFLLYWMIVGMPWRFVDNYELGYKFNATSGELTRLDGSGYHWRRPIVDSIHTVDLRPFQVCISANQRVLNCKLVRFNPDGLETFLEWHGRDNYYLSGSNNSSSSSTSTGSFEDIMRSYAYDGSGRTYPFLIVIRELRNDEVQPVQQ